MLNANLKKVANYYSYVARLSSRKMKSLMCFCINSLTQRNIPSYIVYGKTFERENSQFSWFSLNRECFPTN